MGFKVSREDYTRLGRSNFEKEASRVKSCEICDEFDERLPFNYWQTNCNNCSCVCS